MSFSSLGLSPWLVDALKSLQITRPSAIQSACIPAILKGRDCVGGARTGSGKTAAFALPILQRWSEDPRGIYAIVLTPTRELAIQIADQFAALGASMDLKFATIIGGLDMMEQTIAFTRRPHIVVATPGRLADILSKEEKKINLEFLVLDEADRLLKDSFADDLSVIMDKITKKQTLLFTATMTDAIRQIKHAFVHEVESFVPTLEQKYIFIPSQVKENYLVDILDDDSTIVFCNRTRTVAILSSMLKLLGHRCTSLHSKLSQPERINSLGRFRANAVNLLICTDVASRGLDIPQVNRVIHFDIPRDPDDYIHRSGRTARAGRSGMSIAFITEHDVSLIHAIEDRSGKMTEFETKEGRVLEDMSRVLKAKREAELDFERD